MDEITVVVPTYNRSVHLTRTLKHFCIDENDLNIIVADGSSDKNERKKNENAVNRVKSTLKIEYQDYPVEMGFFERCSILAEQAASPFITFHADDDFLFSSGIKKAARLLETDSSLVAAQGYIMHIGKNKENLSLNVATYPFSPTKFENRIERLNWHMRAYRPTFYSTHRRENCALALKAASKFTTPWLRFTEITASALVSLQGDLGFTDCLYGIRESHPGALSRNDVNWPQIVKHEKYEDTLAEYSQIVSQFLCELDDQLSLDESDKIARKSLLEFLRMVFVPEYRPIPQHIAEQTWTVLEYFNSPEKHPLEHKLILQAVTLICENDAHQKNDLFKKLSILIKRFLN